jgi:carbamate kinase
VAPYPLDVLGAESEGLVGYPARTAADQRAPWAPRRNPTQVIVDADDPAFAKPTKPMGPVHDQHTASRPAAERGWSIGPDGEHYRRVVASPEPRSIVELAALQLLVRSGVLVVCVGGDGIPVVVDERHRLRGVEAVIDKDLSAAPLDRQLEADALLMLTDVPYAEAGWRTPRARPLTHVTPAELRAIRFAAGSMAPKVEAACRFVEATRGTAAIGELRDASALLRGDRGTQVTADDTRRAPDDSPAGTS